jgi:hypothetical protein
VPKPRDILYYETLDDAEEYRWRFIGLGLVSEVVIPTEAPAQPAVPQSPPP